MKFFSANRNLSNLLYRTNGIDNFNNQLRALIHGEASSPEGVNGFFKMQLIGVQTLSQFLVAANARGYPFVTSQTKESLGVSSEQDEAALEDALALFKLTTKGTLLDRTLDYLRDYAVFRNLKDLLGLEKYILVNNLLWFAAIQDDGTGPRSILPAPLGVENQRWRARHAGHAGCSSP